MPCLEEVLALPSNIALRETHETKKKITNICVYDTGINTIASHANI